MCTRMQRRGRSASAGSLVLAHLLLGALVVLALAEQPFASGQEQITVESRDLKQSPSSENELADTLKYLEKLEKLDQYWSEVGRPRFGRSEYKQPLVALKLQQQRQQSQAPQLQQRPRLAGRLMYEPRSASAPGPLADLISARLGQRYYSNDAY